jgi:surface antigen
MAAVGGLFACVALPAYAVNPVETTNTGPLASTIGAQSVAVSADATVAAASRDAFTATTPEELAAANAAATLASSYVYRDPGPRQAGDDYPWAGQEGLSPLRYYYGECVDFVAWRLNRDAGYTSAPFRWDWSTLTPGGGSASSWTDAWYAHGWPVSSTPIAGAVAVTGYNHVAYVKEVLGDGSVLLEEYNYGNYHSYSQRVISAGSATYLYPPS